MKGKMNSNLRVIMVLAVLLLAEPAGWEAGATPAAPLVWTNEVVSVAGDESQGNNNSTGYVPAISSIGRYVAFASEASNLVEADTNGMGDVFVRDRQSGTTEIVSLAYNASLGNSWSAGQSITAAGWQVAFTSMASNLVWGDTNRALDIFVRDRWAGTTERVSVSSDESQATDGSDFPSISSDGRYVAFQSAASNLVDEDTNGGTDIFVRDRAAGTTERVSVANNESQGNSNSQSYPQSISADGRYVAFQSAATNLVDGDLNGLWDVFVRDRVAGTTELVSVASDEDHGDGDSIYPAISADGRYVAFLSFAPNLVEGDTNGAGDIFVRDRVAGTTERVSVASDGSQADSFSFHPAISADGGFVAFESGATNLVAGEDNGFTDVFIRDRLAGTTELASAASDGGLANSESNMPFISAYGRYVAFDSYASNLVAEDHNDRWDVFMRSSGEESALYLPIVTREYCTGFLDDFSDPSSGWYVADNRYFRSQYDFGGFNIQTKTGGIDYLFWAPTCEAYNYNVWVNAQWLEKPGRSYGLIFDIQGNFDYYYLFDINTYSREYRLYRRNPSGFTKIVGPTFSPLIQIGKAFNQLDVLVLGDQFILYLNHVDLGAWVGDNISGAGGVGIVSSSYLSEPESDVLFDDFGLIVLYETGDWDGSGAYNPSFPGLEKLVAPAVELPEW